jgi:septum formation protein
MEQLILASQSPRRMALLRTCGIDYVAFPADIVERPISGEQPKDTAVRLAREKAEAVCRAWAKEPRWILAADTVVAVDGELLGKPTSADQAAQFLLQLRGRTHQVITGLCLVHSEKVAPSLDAVTTQVTMRAYAVQEMRAYIASGDPYDKAGGYAIQHPVFRPVQSMEGCFTNVVGLPMCHVHSLLEGVGWNSPFALPRGCDHQDHCGFRDMDLS